MPATDNRQSPRRDANKLRPEDRPFHDWYRFVLSFPPHLVRDYLERFDVKPGQVVLDPFCGTGTTLVECKKRGIDSIGIEANPMAAFASRVKVDWSPDPDRVESHAREVAAAVDADLAAQGFREGLPRPTGVALRRLPPEAEKLLLTGSISPVPLHKTLVLLEHMDDMHDAEADGIEKLALAKALVTTIGNLEFGPEVGVGKQKHDAPVVETWQANVRAACEDLRTRPLGAVSQVHNADARVGGRVLAPASVDAVITSPPYPNEKDYTRTTRLESVLLGLIASAGELRAMKRGMVRSNTRGVYKTDDDDQWIAEHPEVRRIAEAIEERRVALGKTSGFERLYARVTKLYFGGIARHLAEMRVALKPGAQLAYVVGDQASYLRVMIRTGCLLADIAHSLGYEVCGIDLFRTRLATATREELREEVVVLRWPG